MTASGLRAELAAERARARAARLVADVAFVRGCADRAADEVRAIRAGSAAMHRRAQRAEVCAARALREGLAACAELRRERDRALTSPTAAERREVYGLLESAHREAAVYRRDEAHAQREVARLSAELTAAWAERDDARALVAAYVARDLADGAEVARLTRENDTLQQDRAVLLGLARHAATCSVSDGTYPCDCGLTAIESAAKGGE